MRGEDGVGAPADKRGAVKWHNRRSIVLAAGELASAHGIEGFSVNDLAKRAGVSRRTIFNHFSSSEDAVYEFLSETVGEMIGAVLADLPRPGPTEKWTLGEVYRELAQAMRAHELHELRETLGPIFRHPPDIAASPVAALWNFRLTHGAVERLSRALGERLPDRSNFELQLVATTAINSMAVCIDEWLIRTEGFRETDGARVWDELITETFEILGRGFDT